MNAHVWLAHRESADESCLSATELMRRNRYQQEEDRQRFTTGATLARFALRHRTYDAEADIARRCPDCEGIDHGPLSAAGPHADAWSLSVSHSGDLVAVAIVPGDRPVGIDVEVADLATIDRIKPLLCGEQEYAEDEAAADRHHALLTRWVRKEAILKAAKVGLSVPMRHLRVTPAGRPAQLVSWNPDSVPDGLDPGHVACRDVPQEALAAVDARSRGAVAVVDTRMITLDLHWVGTELSDIRAGVPKLAVAC